MERLAIPLRDLVPEDRLPVPGSTWLFNAFRADKAEDGSLEFSAWQPTLADFHRPYRFPRLRFTE